MMNAFVESVGGSFRSFSAITTILEDNVLFLSHVEAETRGYTFVVTS